jgi:hypothetical protein
LECVGEDARMDSTHPPDRRACARSTCERYFFRSAATPGVAALGGGYCSSGAVLGATMLCFVMYVERGGAGTCLEGEGRVERGVCVCVQRRRAVGPLFIVGRARPESMPRQWWCPLGRPREAPRVWFGRFVTRRCICRLKLYVEPGRHNHHHDTPARGGTPLRGTWGADLSSSRSLPLLVSRFPAGAEPPVLRPHACSERAAAHASTTPRPICYQQHRVYYA